MHNLQHSLFFSGMLGISSSDSEFAIENTSNSGCKDKRKKEQEDEKGDDKDKNEEFNSKNIFC